MTLLPSVNPNPKPIADWFGNSVAICGDGSRIVVGAWLSDARGVRSGAAYVFERNGDPVWGQCYGEEVKLVPSDGQPFDYFGYVWLEGRLLLLLSGYSLRERPRVPSGRRRSFSDSIKMRCLI
jgi:hypothetical protein